MTKKPYVGIYSEKASKGKGGTVIYVDEDGLEYELTAYSPWDSYMWDDKILVTDKPIKFLRSGIRNSDHFSTELIKEHVGSRHNFFSLSSMIKGEK